MAEPTDKPVEIEISASQASSHQGFSSRLAFLFTAIGCAVGFGNVWRFPYLCYRYGGLAFFVPYILGLIFVTWPVYAMEMGLGQMARGGNIKAFSALGRHCRGLGMTGWSAFNICLYYPLLLTWTTMYFVNSFKGEMPWSSTSDETLYCSSFVEHLGCSAQTLCEWNSKTGLCVVDLLGKSKTFFRETCYAYENVLLDEHNLGIVGISGYNVLIMFINWTLNFMGLVAGAKVLGYIMYVTMTLPSIFLVILVIVGITLEGSGLGIKEYIAKFEVSSISSTDAWISAIGQGVFSVGVAQGTGTAFSSHNAKDQNFLQDSVIVIFIDTLFAFLAGFSVFSVIGYLATIAGKEISELPLSGISLAFSTYPVGLSIVPGVGGNIFCALFFMTLWFLGMDTLVGLTEACVMMVCDSRMGVRWNVKRWVVTAVFCGFFFLVPGLLLSTNMGYHFLDAIDTYSSSVAQAFGAGAEAVAVGWIYLSHHAISRVGFWCYVVHCSTWFIGSCLLGLLFQLCGAAVGLPVGFAIMFGGMAAAFFLCKKQDDDGNVYSAVDKLYYMSIFQIEPLRKKFNDEALTGTKIWRLGVTWAVILKYITPTIVCFLFFSTLATPSVMYGRPSTPDLDVNPYPWYVFLIGQLGPFGLVIIATIIFTIMPDWILFLVPPGHENAKIIAEELVPLVLRPGHTMNHDFDSTPTTTATAAPNADPSMAKEEP